MVSPSPRGHARFARPPERTAKQQSKTNAAYSIIGGGERNRRCEPGAGGTSGRYGAAAHRPPPGDGALSAVHSQCDVAHSVWFVIVGHGASKRHWPPQHLAGGRHVTLCFLSQQTAAQQPGRPKFMQHFLLQLPKLLLPPPHA